MTITGKWRADHLRRFLRRAPRIIRGHQRRRLAYWGRYIINSIRRDGKLFKYEQRQRGGRRKGMLKASLWTERNRNSREPSQLLGWGVPWGEVMEFGPARKSSWKIRPSGFRSDATLGRSGAGKALKFLRYEQHGVIKYAREVTHVWTDSQKRPHFAKHLKRHDRGFRQDIESLPTRVFEGKLR
jgi:hypothetical protein